MPDGLFGDSVKRLQNYLQEMPKFRRKTNRVDTLICVFSRAGGDGCDLNAKRRSQNRSSGR